MKLVLIGLFLVTLVLSDSIVEFINAHDFSWKAEVSDRFKGLSIDEIKAMMGFKLDSQFDQARSFIKQYSESYYRSKELTDLPDHFDSREKWGTCVHPVQDQGQCGSCWAFGATGSFSDRLCIASNAKYNFSLSVEQMVSCNMFGLEGCNGGEPVSAFIYTAQWGLPTDSCFPYTAGINGIPPPCRSSCVNSEPWVLYYNQLTSIRWHLTVDWIMDSIYNHGPVEACFTVYEDFMRYKSGIYVHKTGSQLGGHCVILLGWGVEDGMEYWIAQNSWGTSWGDEGYFKIQKGVNMCG